MRFYTIGMLMYSNLPDWMRMGIFIDFTYHTDDKLSVQIRIINRALISLLIRSAQPLFAANVTALYLYDLDATK